MTWLEAIVLGLVQGLTEFLPISSSGHLRIVSEVFFDEDAGAAFTAVTQLGTEAAVLLYFARDIGHLALTWLRGFRSAQVRATQDYRLAWLVILGTLPIGVLGYLLESRIETSARNLWLIATSLVVFGLLLGAAEWYGGQGTGEGHRARRGRAKRGTDELTLRDGIVMGFAQAMALVPGVSRSGGTITAGLFLGLSRVAAVRFSFLLAIPAVVAAGLFSLPDVLDSSGPGLQPSGAQLVVATAIAFAVGLASIAWLLRFVARHTVYVFVGYRVVLGLVLLALLAAGTLSPT